MQNKSEQGKLLRFVGKNTYVKHPYKRVCLSATFGSRFIVLSFRTHQYEHLEEKTMSLAPLFTDIYIILKALFSAQFVKNGFTNGAVVCVVTCCG